MTVFFAEQVTAMTVTLQYQGTESFVHSCLQG
jgi:hypothetical protein